MLNIKALKTGIYHIMMYEGKRHHTALMTKYGILKNKFDSPVDEIPYRAEGNHVEFTAPAYSLGISINCGEDDGFTIDVGLSATDRLFGLGDENREHIMKRGCKADLWQQNVKCYGPIPYVMSSRGWGILVNCTYRHSYDLGAEQNDVMKITCEKGTADIFVFLADSMRGALELYTDVSGKPVMLPKGAYGLTFVFNEEENARMLLDDCRRFRQLNIPCDILGLEPSWMQKHYDSSTDKKWNREKFYIPYWMPENYYGSWSFIYNLNKMGYMLSLWLCCDYDLFWKEENEAAGTEKLDFKGAAIADPHFTSGIRMDKITRPDKPWFEHLKKFVDNGAEAFKLDGSSQIVPFPDRLWAGKYLDEEIHNLYPLIYAKQMKEGYEAHTGKRAMIYTCGSYAGTQQYAATWAGDTGCNVGVLASLLNLGMCGHTNASFDITPDSIEKVHFGFLAPWSQDLGWDNWMYPWYLGDDTEESYRFYSQLRSSLFPYIYSYAHNAAETGYPIARALSLAYPDTDKYDNVLNEYMFGDSLLVTVFDKHVVLPDSSDWTDYWTGKIYKGGTEFDYEPPKGRGGALFVKSGSIVVTQDWAHSLRDYQPTKLYVNVYPGGDAKFTLYEDDGKTYAYKNGEYAVTEIILKGDILTIGERKGSYNGMKPEVDFEIAVHKNGSVSSAPVKADSVNRSFDINLI